VDVASGAIIWRTDLPVYLLSGIAITGGRVFAVSRLTPNYPAAQQGRLYALNATTGAVLWSATTAATMDGNPAAANGLVYVGTQYTSQGMIAFDSATGAIRWQRQDVTQFRQTPAVTSSALLVTNSSGGATVLIRALNPLTGAQLWSVNTAAPAAGGDPIVANGVVYFGSRIGNRVINAVRLDTGATLTTLQLATGSGNHDISPEIVNGTVLGALTNEPGSGTPTLQAFRLP